MGDETAASSVQQHEKGLLMLHNARSAKVSRSSGFLGPGGPANADFLREQQEKFEIKKRTYAEGDILDTKLHTVIFSKGNQNSILKRGKEIHITLVEFDSDEAGSYIEKVLAEIYRMEAKRILPEKLQHLADYYGFKFNKVTIRNNKRNCEVRERS